MRIFHLAGSRGYWLGVLAALIVGLPILGFGFFVDDYMFLATLAGHNPLGSPVNLFMFGPGNPEQMTLLMESGPYPWFGDLDFKAHFFRPLGSLMMSLDHQLFGHYPFAYNAHSLFWYVLLCFSAMLLFRRTLPPAAGVLSLFLFVVDESHVLPAAWWSNRHSVMAVCLGCIGIVAHLRWRNQQWRPGLPLSLVLYALALLSSETGLCMLAYVLAYETFGAQDAPCRRFTAVLPASVLAVAYVVFYWLSDYGARHSDIYVNPLSNPVAYLSVAPARFVMLSGAQFFMLPVEATLLHAWLEPLFVALGAVGLALVAAALYILWPRFNDQEQRALRWLIPGAVLATTPVLSAIVNARVLLAASLGGAAIIACIILGVWREMQRVSSTPLKVWTLRLAFTWIVVAHLFIAALSWPGQVILLRTVMSHLNGFVRNSELDEDRMGDSQVVVLNAPEPYSGMYPLMLRSFDGSERPRSWWTISFAPHAHRITRTGANELEMEVIDGQMLVSVMERLFRSAKRPLHAGYEVDLGGLTVTVLDMGDKGPTRLRLLFEEDLASERYQILAFRQGVYRRFEPPALGQDIELPKPFR